MKQPTYFKIGLAILTLFLSLQSFSQNLVPFVPRYDGAIRGDMLLIGNSNIGVHRTNAYNGNDNNESNTNRDRMVYVDIDNDNTTFNSSSANLDVPSDADCYQIVYAGLYWSSVVRGTGNNRNAMQNVKFKTPGSSSYIDLTGTQIYYQNSSDNRNSDTYVYYRDVTDILAPLGNNREGTYTVANISANTSDMMTRGRNTEGLSAGWSLFVIYEDPTKPSKYITSFDGFTKIDNQAPNNQQTFPITGFQTIPTGPVNAKYAFSALEGDRGWSGDYLRINNTTISATAAGNNVIRPSNNFFNSSVSIINPTTNTPMLFTARNPASSNTLGFDAGIINIPNPNNSVIANGATSANIRLGTNTDIYYFYFSAFAIEIIAPKIVLTKIVEDVQGNDIGGQVVSLGDELYYTIGFQNTGNDNARDLIIRDVLPDNVVFNYPQDLGLLPNGVSVQSYNPATKELIFSVNNSLVEKNDPVYNIRFKVTVVATCSLLSNACSNSINNQAYATYKGTVNPTFTISDDPSFSSNTGCLVNPGPTNFLANLDDCVFEENVILCGANVVLTAGSGYDSYSWSTSPTGTPVIGTSQSLTVTTPGTYYVHNTAVAPCQSIDQVFHVERYGGGVTNPVIPFADEVVICPNDGAQLPNIYLCGANDSRFIQTNITDTSSMIWERLVEGSCDAVLDGRCANQSTSCIWQQVATGPDFSADTAGQYRLTLNYAGGCFNQFYFNVYENLLEPTATSRDIICTTPGEITVGGVPNGYEYSIDGVNYQSSNEFTINTPNAYTVYVRQVGVSPNPCVFTVPNVQVRQRDFTVTTNVIPPLCHDGRGSIVVAANDARPQYTFTISQGGTLINSSGLIMDNDFTFDNLNPGTYTINVTTEDGCVFSDTVEIMNPPILTATAALTQPLTCTDGEITVYPNGGTEPYYYFVNGSEEFQSTNIIEVTAPGVYNILVVDANNCSTETSITVTAMPQPAYTVTDTDILCYNSNTGVIQFNVTNANGYTIAYSIDNGVTYSSSPTFSNLAPGTYAANIRYSLNGAECFSAVQNLVITQPDAGLTASAGVSELAGCGPGGTGRVRITNPQGGTAPYEYSFDNQATWVNTNEAYVNPGTYTLYIRDANGCIFPMSGITLNPEPVAPTISVSDPNFNCEGSASSTVTITNPDSSSFTYRYLINGVENPNTANPNVFLNVPSGTHTVTVEYTLATVPTYSNLLYETFGYGDDTTSPGINTTYYCFERQVEATKCNGNIQINDGDYSVTSRIVSPFSTWMNPTDHTPQTTPATPKGRYMVVNIGASIPKTAILYEKQINDIIPNQPINVEFFAMNLLRSGTSGFDPDLLVALVDASGNEISSFATGNIPKSNQWENYPKTPMTLNPGSNTSLKFIIRSNVQQTNGNDVAIDDISVYQLPAVCTTTVDFPFVVASGNGFSAQIVNATDATCAGANDGTVTIAAQNFDPAKGFQYSMNNGASWTTSMSSPVVVSGLAPNTYDIQVRYENAADTCVESFTQAITEPAVLEITASATAITCDENSTITVSATGGSPAYTFELLDATSNLVANIPNSGILANVLAGDYIVRVTDINGCTDTFALNIASYTPPIASLVDIDYCYDGTGSSFEVTVSGGVAPYQYSVNGSAYTSNNTFNNLVPGNYTVTVIDAYGCPVTLPTLTIAPQVAVSTVLTKELDCTVSPDAVITGTISNGYAPYTVTLIQGTGTVNLTGNTFTLTTDTDGAYQFRVTDANGCETISNVTTISPLVLPTATTTVVNVSCYGGNDGSFQIIPSGGVGPYTYSIDGGTTFTPTFLYTGLAEGAYTYIVRDANGCTFEGSETIEDPDALVATASATAFLCNADNTAQSATVTIDLPTGGTAPYSYSFNGSGFSSNNTLTVHDNGTTQTINYSVRDANNCSVSGSVSIAPLNSPTDLTFSANPVTCDNTTTDVTLTATNGVGPLTYEILSPASATSNTTGATTGVFTGLTPNTYLFRVTDANGCYYSESFTVNPVTPIAVIGTKISDVLCFGDNTGEIRFNVSGTTGFTYTINGGTSTVGTSPISLSGLAEGSYVIEVTDTATGCTDTDTIVIDEPAAALGLTLEATNVHCNNFESQITADVSGGTPNYTFAAVTSGSPAPSDAAYASGNIITVDTNLGLIWDVYVKDANGCIESTSITIDVDDSPTIDDVTVNNQCDVSSGFTFTVTASGGVGTLRYSINGGAYQASSTFTVNAPGSYTVTVIDDNGCTATSATATEVYPPITVSTLLTKDLTCSVPTNATIEGTISGGRAPYTIATIQGPGTATVTGNTFTFTTPDAGTYQFEITDANLCTQLTSIITVNAIIPVTASVIDVDPTCNGGSDGSITLTPQTGEAPFTYSINGGAFVSSNVFGGLVSGNYVYVVRDSKGCEFSDTITLDNPDPINAAIVMNPIQCNVNTPGSFDVSVTSGGTAPYIYNLYDDAYTLLDTYTEMSSASTLPHSFTGLNFGDYYITIVDANGCEFSSGRLRIDTPPYLNFTGILDSNNCATGIEYTVTTSGGTGDYIYSLFGQPGTATLPTSSTSHTFTGLLHGVTYFFQVEDVNGCISIWEATMPDPPSGIEITATSTTNVNCFGSADGTLDFTVQSYDASVTDINYEVLNALTLMPVSPAINGTLTGAAGGPVSGSISTLPVGSYVLQVTEDSGTLCSNTFTFYITQPTQPLSSSIANVVNANCYTGAQVTITTTGGTGPYQYAAGAPGFTPTIGDFGSSNVLNLDPSTRTNWEIVVLDSNGCEVRLNQTIASDPEPTLDSIDPFCFEGTPYDINLVATGLAPLTYSVNGSAFQTSSTFTITAADTYTFIVKDANGCEATQTLIVNPPLLLDATLDLDLTCTDAAEITLTPSGGAVTAIYTYEVSFNGAGYTVITGSPYTPNAAGAYIFRVTDSQGCTAVSNEIIVTTPTIPILTLSSQINVSCNGLSDGSVIVTASNGIVPYEYRIDGGAWQTSNEFTGLAAGDYTIEVRDGKNCETTIGVTITEPLTLEIATVDVTPFACDVNNTAQSATVIITVDPTTGTAPYQYSFNGGAFTSTNTLTVIDNGSIQTITYVVRDANGCTDGGSIDIDPLASPTDLTFAESNPITCDDPTTDVTLSTTGGVGALAYEIMFPATAIGNTSGATTGIFTGLLPDTYIFRVTDANGCYYTEAYTVVPVTNITVSGQLMSDANCNAEANGSIEFDVSNFASTYSYTINGGLPIGGQTDPTISLTGLTAGDYTIVVTDEDTGCTDTVTVTVNEPDPLTLAEIDNINAYCDFGAIVTVQASGGTAPYRYAFVTSGSAPVLADYTSSNTAVLDPAISTDWDVWVMDSNGCVELIDVVIATDPLPTITVDTQASNQCTVDTGFEFEVTNVNGVGPFTYSIGNGFQSSPIFTVSTPGNYTVTVKDAHGCTNTAPVTIDIYPALNLNAAVTTLPSCSDDDGVITITGAGGSGDYTYSISPIAGTITGNVISGLAAGTYTVTITDDVTGCTDEVEVTLEAPTPVTFTPTPTDVSCIGGSDGTITVNLPASNDNPIYTYSIDGGITTQTSNVFTGLPAGTYTVLVTSGRGCVATEDVTINEPTAITVPAPLVVDYACTVGTNSSNFATITVTGVTGGSGTYTRYEFIRDGNVVQNGANNVYTETDFLGGNYTINVYDDNNCIGSTTATVLPFISIDDLDVAIDNPITCINDEDITVSVTSTGVGTPNLEYTVEDVVGSVLGTVYSQTNATGVFTGLPVGNYIITVTDLDTGCTLQRAHYINEPNTFDLTIDSVVDVTCFAGSDGSVNVTFIDRSPMPTDESGPFSYEIFDSLGNSVQIGTAPNPGPIAITGLASGTYTITATLTNDPFCTVSKNFTINAPTAALAIAETHTEITCVSGNNDGTISVTATGGWPGGYEYQLEISGGTVLVEFGTVSNFTGLTANTYIVTVRDSRGCEDSVTVTLDNPDPITATVTADINLLACFGDTNATIRASAVSGGQGSNYTYTLNMISPAASSSGPQLSPVFSGLGAGTYTVTVNDGFNCEFTSANIVIDEPVDIQALLVRETSPTCEDDASLTLSATGGTAPYEYSTTSSFTTSIAFTSSVTFSVPVGTYEYYVRDANGCLSRVSNEITIDPVPDLIINLDLTNAIINCAGDNTGVIVAVAQGGLGNYVYTLLDGSGNPIPTAVQNSPGVFTELYEGNYQVLVESGDCVTTSPAIIITEPADPLTADFFFTDPTCFGSGDGRLEIVASGGTGIIKYAISPQLNQFFETSVFENLYPGTYQAIAQDELGCYILFDFTITDPTPVQIALVPDSIVPELCEGDLNAAFSIVVTGGAMPYSVTLDDRNGSYITGGPTQTQFDFTGLSGGDHTVYVIDGAGCESEMVISLPESVSFRPVAVVNYDCDNNLPSNTVIVNITGNVDTADLSYSLNGGAYQTSNIFVNVPSGVDNYIDVMHANGCLQTTPLFDVEHFDPLAVALDEVDGTFNTIVAVTTGGSGVYQYTFNGEDNGTKNTFQIYRSGDYTVTVTDSYGCSVSATQYFEYIDVCIPNYFTPNGTDEYKRWGPGFCATQYTNLTVDIFDRYGRAIATLRVGDFWDGNYNGKELPSGDYWYVVKLNDPKDNRSFVGHFTLYR